MINHVKKNKRFPATCHFPWAAGYEQDPLSHPAATDEQIDWAPVAGLVVVASAVVVALKGQGAP